ncbi:MAG: exodeoxyribonuclease VII large subunit [Desulfotignum sp.]|nr:exodeoxyribonuclease VII large subunit [Desulfotignum sp.]MCF8137137.1 exodeoxyribonuclease VII large subunit [Desulfotignum sp.]
MPDHETMHIYSVSHLTREIKTLLEEQFPFVWITGEISNCATPASGHSYFSLKDDHAMISGVMFKNQKRSLKFALESGLKIMGLARVSVYEPRGTYQLIFEHMEPEGAGSLQKAFEQLKNKLEQEGLFDAVHKQPIPLLPRKISIITSGTGAAVRDIIHVSERRFPECRLEILPVPVQGESACDQIVCAIKLVNQRHQSDVIMLARGGGSLEDMAAFNSEAVARAIFVSKIPVVTGIGHETDFTIADFVADVRAPTPSAAAELTVPEKKYLTQQIDDMHVDLLSIMTRMMTFYHQKVDDLHGRLKSPVQIMNMFKQTMVSLCLRMQQALQRQIFHDKDKLVWMGQALNGTVPDIKFFRKQVLDRHHQLFRAMEHYVIQKNNRIQQTAATLSALNPASVLNRGYSIARTLPDKQVILDAGMVNIQDPIEIILAQGRVLTRVEKTIHGKDHI